MGQISLFGASGHAKVVTDIVIAQGDEVGHLYDDNPHLIELDGVNVERPLGAVVSPIIISIGSNRARKTISERLDVIFARAIHPSAIISPSVVVGCGTVIMQGSVIQADTSIGQHCIINTSASIDHECKIGDYVHVSPHSTLCGNVEIGEGSWIGAGAIVIQGIKIGKWCTIGAGTVVLQDIPDGATAVGIPSRIIYSMQIGAI